MSGTFGKQKNTKQRDLKEGATYIVPFDLQKFYTTNVS